MFTGTLLILLMYKLISNLNIIEFFRYGQKKPCYIYRLVSDNSLEKKVYDRQIGKQWTADRVVDQLNPEAQLSLKDITSLVCDDEEDPRASKRFWGQPKSTLELYRSNSRERAEELWLLFYQRSF